ncbi:hypothetical protein [Lysinibacillus capsici]|jgi:hypothetical protein|uniref:hypothetical protein n=1 Tax=Lysinibacillus capsici TaxID=2115968 RepID=UPI0028BE17A7|nr:hypothetical protein [Lysinibacillus capsici]MED3796585.1 hypothetical protein [Lysinibacillus capsici]MED4555304.1 hypothetical protein [Lysinibacillus capsici]WNN76488.1 hypothetical protein RKS58_01315 [Lysinibacillus capsici]
MLDQQIPNIPWRQLTTPYGRGTAIPKLIEQEQYTQLAELIEHQGTLWQVTPWVLLVLLKKLTRKKLEVVSLQEVQLYLAVAHAITKDYLDPVNTVKNMQELLDVNYLWIENEDNDEQEWEKETPKGYEEQAFVGYYYYSYMLLQEAVPIFSTITARNNEASECLAELLTLLRNPTIK